MPDGDPLASQPTRSRSENGVADADLRRLVGVTVATGVERLLDRNRGTLPASVTLDLDATDDPTRGGQQLSLFHGYYGQYQYFPLVISGMTTRHAFLAQLRHGTAHASLGADDDLMKVVAALRAAPPDVAVHVRGDAGFGLPLMYDACEANGLTYTLGFTSNPRPKRLAEGLMARAVEQFKATGEKARLFAAALGFTQATAADLKAALLHAARTAEAVPTRHNGFGQLYEIRFNCTGPTRTATVLSVWVVLDATPVPQLVPCYPV